MFHIVLYVLTRAYHYLHLPPFVDELLYIRWTDTIAKNWQQFWLPITEDGQPPLYIWLGAILKYLSSLDTLIILRSLSIFFGLLVLILLRKIITEFISERVSKITVYVYILFPMFLWYDRLAMRESMITLAGLIVVYGLSLRLIKNNLKGNHLIVTGFTLGLMTKGTAILFLPIILVTYIIFRKNIKLKSPDYFSLISLFTITLSTYLFASNIFAKGQSFLLSWHEIFSRLYLNTYSTINWIIQYSTLSWTILALLGLSITYKAKNSFLYLFSVIFAITIAIQIASADIFFPRYFLWVMPFWLIMISLGIEWLSKQFLGKLLVLALLVSVLSFDYHILDKPLQTPLPEIEKWQYLTGWPSGYGIKEMAQVISHSNVDLLLVENNEACKAGIPYYTQAHYAITTIDDYDTIQKGLSQNQHIFACINIADTLDLGGSTNLVSTIVRPEGKSSLRLYEITAE